MSNFNSDGDRDVCSYVQWEAPVSSGSCLNLDKAAVWYCSSLCPFLAFKKAFSFFLLLSTWASLYLKHPETQRTYVSYQTELLFSFFFILLQQLSLKLTFCGAVCSFTPHTINCSTIFPKLLLMQHFIMSDWKRLISWNNLLCKLTSNLRRISF